MIRAIRSYTDALLKSNLGHTTNNSSGSIPQTQRETLLLAAVSEHSITFRARAIHALGRPRWLLAGPSQGCPACWLLLAVGTTAKGGLELQVEAVNRPHERPPSWTPGTGAPDHNGCGHPRLGSNVDTPGVSRLCVSFKPRQQKETHGARRAPGQEPRLRALRTAFSRVDSRPHSVPSMRKLLLGRKHRLG